MGGGLASHSFRRPFSRKWCGIIFCSLQRPAKNSRACGQPSPFLPPPNPLPLCFTLCGSGINWGREKLKYGRQAFAGFLGLWAKKPKTCDLARLFISRFQKPPVFRRLPHQLPLMNALESVPKNFCSCGLESLGKTLPLSRPYTAAPLLAGFEI